MQFPLSVATLLALAFPCLAAPTANLAERGGGFEVKQVANGHRRRNGPLEMERTFVKFGAVVPDFLAKAAAVARKQEGSVVATPEPYDQAYVVPVTVGNSKLMMDIDTGSSDLWVFSTITKGRTAGHSLYNVQTGTRQRRERWHIKYGDNSFASGLVYTDQVVMGGVTATDQAVEAAIIVSAQFRANRFSDGLVGFAFDKINQVSPRQVLTWFDNVKFTLTLPIFTADLKAGAPGSYTFGYIDKSKYTGSITTVPVDHSMGFWGFSSSYGPAIADSGTSLMYLPARVVAAYYRQVPGAELGVNEGGYIFPCNSHLPDFPVVIGGTTFTVPGKYINYAPIGPNYCFGGLQPDTGIGFSIFGDLFLKTVYVVFDKAEPPTIGFATKNL